MGWFRDSFSLLREAASQNKVLLTVAGGLLLFLGAADTAQKFVQERISDWIMLPRHGESVLMFGVPSSLLAVMLASFIIAFWLLLYAGGLRKRLTPKIDVQFNPKGEGIVLSPTHVYERDQTGNITGIREDEAVYVSITLMTLSETTIRNCVAFLTKIERRLIPTGPFVDIPVFSLIPLLPNPIDVHPQIPIPVSFLKAGRSDNKLEFSMSGWPLRLRGAFDQSATYRCTIGVNGDGVTRTIQVDVDWAGKWDAITARQVV
jgi:hypothetical protein